MQICLNFVRKSLLLTGKWLDRHQTCTRWSESLHQGCAQVQGRGGRSRDPSTFWNFTKKSLTKSFPNFFSFPLSIRFSSASQSPNGGEFALWVLPAHMVKQFVRLIAIQYGLTFCLYVRSLYEAPLHSPSRQLDVMSKSWNELLRHWRSGRWYTTTQRI